MYGVLASLLKYIFITIIYLFIFSIIRLIYLDIRSVSVQKGHGDKVMPYLKLINRKESLGFRVSETYPLTGDVKIGRIPKNEISIPDPFLSSTHAEIHMADGKYFIRDNGSTNGTFVNGKQLHEMEAPLNDGDRIHLGQVEFLFVSGGR